MPPGTLKDYLYPILGGLAAAISPDLGRGIAVGSGIAYGVQRNKLEKAKLSQKRAEAEREAQRQASLGNAIQQWAGKYSGKNLSPKQQSLLGAITTAGQYGLGVNQFANLAAQFAGGFVPPPPSPEEIRQSLSGIATVTKDIVPMLPPGASITWDTGRGYNVRMSGQKAADGTDQAQDMGQVVQHAMQFVDKFNKRHPDLQMLPHFGANGKVSFNVKQRRMTDGTLAGRQLGADITEKLEKEIATANTAISRYRKIVERYQDELETGVLTPEEERYKRGTVERLKRAIAEAENQIQQNTMMLYGAESDEDMKRQQTFEADPVVDVIPEPVVAQPQASPWAPGETHLRFDENGNPVQ